MYIPIVYRYDPRKQGKIRYFPSRWNYDEKDVSDLVALIWEEVKSYKIRGKNGNRHRTAK